MDKKGEFGRQKNPERAAVLARGLGEIAMTATLPLVGPLVESPYIRDEQDYESLPDDDASEFTLQVRADYSVSTFERDIPGAISTLGRQALHPVLLSNENR